MTVERQGLVIYYNNDATIKYLRRIFGFIIFLKKMAMQLFIIINHMKMILWKV